MHVLSSCFQRDPLAEGLDSLIGGLAVAAAVLAVVLISEKIRGVEAMGGGDIKLLFVTGLYLGWKGNILCLFAACIIGIIFGLTFNKQAGLETETEAAVADGQYLHGDDNVKNAELSSESSTEEVVLTRGDRSRGIPMGAVHRNRSMAGSALWKPADRLVCKSLLEEISGNEIVGKKKRDEEIIK